VKKVIMAGVCGKMGMAMTSGLLKEDWVEVIGGYDKYNIGQDIGTIAGCGATGKKVYSSWDEIAGLEPDLIIDFTNAQAAIQSINWALDNGIDIIVGATGFGKQELSSVERKVKNSRSKVFIVPNFSIGAVLMVKISSMVASYFDACEIIELHHDKKKDAPSGTSLLTADGISAAKDFGSKRLRENEVESHEGSRGAFYEGVHIHSVRLPGFLAHQEVIFGTAGQTLTLRHDSIDRTSFYPGLILAIKKIDTLGSFTFGLDKIIEL
jgi:4-hydroxy-tetrahydrodipicolinate reductase